METSVLIDNYEYVFNIEILLVKIKNKYFIFYYVQGHFQDFDITFQHGISDFGGPPGGGPFLPDYVIYCIILIKFKY